MSDSNRDLKPWHQTAEESARAFHAFAHYRDLEPQVRSLESAYEVHRQRCLPQGKGGTKTVPSQWKLWSAKNCWVDRAHGYDKFRDALVLETGERDYVAAQERWLSMARDCQDRAMKALSRKDLNSETVRELRLLVTEAVKMERESLEFRPGPPEPDAAQGIRQFLEATRPSAVEVAALFEVPVTPDGS